MTETILSRPGAVLYRDGRAKALAAGKRRYTYVPNGVPPLRDRQLSEEEVRFLEEPTIRLTFKSDKDADEEAAT